MSLAAIAHVTEAQVCGFINIISDTGIVSVSFHLWILFQFGPILREALF